MPWVRLDPATCRSDRCACRRDSRRGNANMACRSPRPSSRKPPRRPQARTPAAYAALESIARSMLRSILQSTVTCSRVRRLLLRLVGLLWLPWLAVAGATSAAFYSHIVGLLISSCDTRQCIEKVTCRDGACPVSSCAKGRGKPRLYFGVVISRTTSCMRAR